MAEDETKERIYLYYEMIIFVILSVTSVKKQGAIPSYKEQKVLWRALKLVQGI